MEPPNETTTKAPVDTTRILDAFSDDPASINMTDMVVETECELRKPGLGAIIIGFNEEGKPCGEGHASFQGEDGTDFDLTDAEIYRMSELIDKLDKRGMAA
jgi:hypothetical protein